MALNRSRSNSSGQGYPRGPEQAQEENESFVQAMASATAANTGGPPSQEWIDAMGRYSRQHPNINFNPTPPTSDEVIMVSDHSNEGDRVQQRDPGLPSGSQGPQ